MIKGMKVWAIILLLGIFPACITEIENRRGMTNATKLNLYSDQEVHQFRPMFTRYNLSPPLSTDYSSFGEEEEEDLFKPYRKFSKMRYLSEDGSIIRHFYLEAGTADRVSRMLVGHLPQFKLVKDVNAPKDPKSKDKDLNRVAIKANFITDEKKTIGVGTTTFSKKYNPGPRPALDLLVVKADSEMIYEAESFIARYLTEIPQIEIKVKVMEVSLQDKFEYGADTLVYKKTGSSKSFLNTLFEPDGTYKSGGWTTKFNTESFQISGIDKYQGTIFHVSGIHDKMAMDSFIEMVQRTTDSQILTAPKITVLDKHKAVIETGVKVPVQNVDTKINVAVYKYSYEPTGVKLVILPSLLMDNTLQIEISGEVNTISGYETVDSGSGFVSVPIFTSRNINNIIRVREGDAFAIGGLLSRSEIEQVSKIPLIGDIPILGYFFKSKKKEYIKKEIVFYIEPRIVRQSDALYIPE